MRGQTVSIAAEPLVLRIEECCNCGVLFGMTEQLRSQRLRDKGSFYCPNGHGQSYLGKSHAEQLAEAQRQTASAREDARIAEAARAAAETETRRLKAEQRRQAKRSAAGVCPCCTRSFVQLARHMKTQHPDHVETE